MKTAQFLSYADLDGLSTQRIHWMKWAVFFFFSASLFGLLLRYFFVGRLPVGFEFSYLLHTHSHLALLGWGYLLLTGGMVFCFVQEGAKYAYYQKLLGATVVANLGMMASFPFQGYGLYSIAFSTLHVIVSYLFAYRFFQDVKNVPKSVELRLVRFAVVWMLISSLGLWSVAPMGILFGKTHPMYFLSVQWFLHFQLNGWFVYGMLGLLVYFLRRREISIPFSALHEYLLHLSLFLTFALTIFWKVPWTPLIYINAVGVVAQAIAYLWVLFPLFYGHFQRFQVPSTWRRRLIYLGGLSLLVKAAIQLTLIIPEVAEVSYGIRSYVIGFIHLVLLGGLSFGVGGIALKSGWIPFTTTGKIGWTLLVVGFLASELLLMTQGTLAWASLPPISSYQELLFVASIFMPLGLACIFIGMFRRRKDKEEQIKLIKQAV